MWSNMLQGCASRRRPPHGAIAPWVLNTMTNTEVQIVGADGSSMTEMSVATNTAKTQSSHKTDVIVAAE